MESKWLGGPGRNLTRFGEAPNFKEGLYRLSSGCYSWMVPNGSWGETNIGLIDCDGKSVLVDTCWDLKFTQELLETADPILRKSPVETVVNTHADGDHCWGNQLFKDKEIIATNACIKQMHHHNPKAMMGMKKARGALRYMPVKNVDKLGHYMGTMFSPYDFGPITITDPNKGFSGSHEFTVNGVDIVVSEVGPGHTDGDAIVYVPSQKVAYAGDILFIGITPVMWAGPVENLVAGIEKIQSLGAETIVPGHGPMATPETIQQVKDYWHFAHEEIHARYQQDKEPAVAAMEVLHSREFKATPFAHWDSPERMVTNAYTLYRNWGADLKSLPGILGVLDQFRHQAQAAFSMPAATPPCMHRF